MLARHEQGVAIVHAAIAAGLIRDADPDTILDMLYAPLYYRFLVGHQPLSAAFIRKHVTLALNGLTPRAHRPPHARGVGCSRA